MHKPEFIKHHALLSENILNNRIFPNEFFIRLKQHNLIGHNITALNIECAEGAIARGLSKHGCKTFAISTSRHAIYQAIKLARKEELDIDFRVSSAYDTEMPSHSFDIVVAGEDWQILDFTKTIQEMQRILKPNGVFIASAINWLPLKNYPTNISKRLISVFNQRARQLNYDGFYTKWATLFSEHGFCNLETFTFDQYAHCSQSEWCEYINHSALIANTLNSEQLHIFDHEHQQALTKHFPDKELLIPFRCFTLIVNPNQSLLL